MKQIVGFILLGVYAGIAAARATNIKDAVAHLALIFAVLLLAGCSAAPDWRPVDTKREVAYQLIVAADAWQTSQIQYRPDVVEAGPMARSILGAEPSTRDAAMYFASIAVSHYAISRVLPPKWRAWWQNTSLLYHTSVVYENCTEYKLC